MFRIIIAFLTCIGILVTIGMLGYAAINVEAAASLIRPIVGIGILSIIGAIVTGIMCFFEFVGDITLSSKQEKDVCSRLLNLI